MDTDICWLLGDFLDYFLDLGCILGCWARLENSEVALYENKVFKTKMVCRRISVGDRRDLNTLGK